MGRDQLGHSRRSADARAMDCRNLVDAGAQNWGGLEAAGHRGRLSTAPGGNRFPRLATTFCARRPGRCGIATIPISIGGHRSDLLSIAYALSLIHISEPTRLGMISYAVFCLKKKTK